MECCIDADRLVLQCGYGEQAKAEGIAADKLVGELIRQYDYNAVLRRLSKIIQFV
jgi:hypothetical protein